MRREPWLDDYSSSKRGRHVGCCAGPPARPRARDRRPGRGSHTSYSACGIPYVVGGVVDDLDDLVVRTPEQFRRDSIDVHVQHEVTGIDLDAGQVKRSTTPATARCRSASTSRLMVGLGAPRPRRPDLPGMGLPFVRGVQTLDDGAALLDLVAAQPVRDVVVVGGGYIGLEMAEAFVGEAPESCSWTPPTT